MSGLVPATTGQKRYCDDGHEGVACDPPGPCFVCDGPGVRATPGTNTPRLQSPATWTSEEGDTDG